LFIDYISKLKRDMVIKKFKKAAKLGTTSKAKAAAEASETLAEDKESSHHIG